MVFKDMSFIPGAESNLLDKVFSLSDDLKIFGFERKILYGLYEVIKNAYEHGNKKDLSKKIFLKQNLRDDFVEFLIGDGGTSINSSFFDYLNHLDIYENFYSKSFYDFKGILPAERHGGVGIKTVKRVFDFFNYAKTSKGGLEVYLLKFK